MLTFLTGGARSGKSSLAVGMAAASGDAVVFLATARPEGDAEWHERLARHRGERPASWTTVEEPLDVVGAVTAADPDAFLVVDCLTLWAANAVDAGWDDDEIEALAVKGASAAAVRPGSTVVVTNEVGGGIVPVERAVRRFRDVLGRTNAVWSQHADRAYLVVAGRLVPLLDAGA
ncbi:MAG: adenosylcobinamide kinase / adenosylcobinamide-phosphate guanylyltransferase [Actinomycetota bacterium]|jgi:adenosyl cobinamide kinase/adenosyl cobinamide phosphate guanylyltransferase